jgi:hypothetical protein
MVIDTAWQREELDPGRRRLRPDGSPPIGLLRGQTFDDALLDARAFGPGPAA